MIALYASQIGRKESNNIPLQVTWAANDIGRNVSCAGLLGNLKTAYMQAKTVTSKEQIWGSMLAANATSHCFHFSVVKAGEK